MDKIVIKNASTNIFKELKSIGFDNNYIETAQKKYKGFLYKLFNLKPYEANILKQICLSLGFDCAISKNSITCRCETTDCLIFATHLQYEKLIEKLKLQPFRLKNIAELLSEQLQTYLEPLKIRNCEFDWKRPYVMGILNVTPDSFSDGGKFNTIDKAYEHFLSIVNDGADIIDIGGESTRPDANIITINEEIERIIPIINKIRKFNSEIPISIDTRNYETAKVAIEAGADIINDVSGLDYDKKLFDYVTKNNIPCVITHSNKIPAVSSDFTNNDIVEEIYTSLENKIDILKKNGMDKKNIIIDMGFGFGKSIESNFEILNRQHEFLSLKAPILIGISRKSFITNSFNISTDEADYPTAFYSAISNSINIHRVHNVKLTKQFLDYTNLIKCQNNH